MSILSLDQDDSISSAVDFLRKRVAENPSQKSPLPTLTKHDGFSSVSYFSVPKCIFCETIEPKTKENYFSKLVDKALYIKYSSSQNYYYTKDINEIIEDVRSASVVRFRDLQHFVDDIEYLKRFYKRSEHQGKLKMLGEYYKYHNEIPRIFIQSICEIVNNFHDRKRRIDYYKITKQLQEDKQKKKISTRKREKIKLDEQKFIPITNRVLDELNFTDYKYTEKVQENEKKRNESPKPKPTVKVLKLEKDSKGFCLKNQDNTVESRDISVSNTIQELNLKLGEIINNSHHKVPSRDILSYFDNSQQHPNETLSNLDNFLKHIQTSKQTSKLNSIPSIPLQQPNQQRDQSPTEAFRSSATPIKFSPTLKPTITNSHNININRLLNKPLNTEPALTQETSKRVSPDNFDLRARLVTLTDEQKAQNREGRIPAFISAKLSSDPVTPSMTARPKNPSVVVTKIRNFDEILKSRPQGSPLKIHSQRSTSRESIQVNGPSGLSSRNQVELKLSKAYESKSKEMAKRRESQNNQNQEFLNGKLNQSNKYGIERNGEHIEAGATSPNARVRKLREMRISVDIRSLQKQGSYQEGSSNIASNNNTGNPCGVEIRKSINKISTQNKITPGTLTNLSPSIKPTRMIADYFPVQTTKELKSLGSFKQLDTPTKTQGSTKNIAVPIIPLQKAMTQSLVNLNPKSEQRIPTLEDKIVNLKQANDKLLEKAATQRESKNMIHHKYTKSEEKLERLETIFEKKSSVPYAGSNRSPDNATFSGNKSVKQSGSSSARQMYAFNQTNIVNIYVNPQGDNNTKIKTEPNVYVKRSSQKKITGVGDYPPGATIKLTDPTRFQGPEVLSRYNQSPSIRTEPFYTETGHESPRSPSKMGKREDLRTRSKNPIYGSSYAMTVSNPSLKSSMQPKTKSKVELDLLKKEMKEKY